MRRAVVVLAGTVVLSMTGGPITLTPAGGGSGGHGAEASGVDPWTRASAAALAATGGGRVTATEVGDGESQYEVEVMLGDGRRVDVQLDTDFAVVSRSGDRRSGAQSADDPDDGDDADGLDDADGPEG